MGRRFPFSSLPPTSCNREREEKRLGIFFPYPPHIVLPSERWEKEMWEILNVPHPLSHLSLSLTGMDVGEESVEEVPPHISPSNQDIGRDREIERQEKLYLSSPSASPDIYEGDVGEDTSPSNRRGERLTSSHPSHIPLLTERRDRCGREERFGRGERGDSQICLLCISSSSLISNQKINFSQKFEMRKKRKKRRKNFKQPNSCEQLQVCLGGFKVKNEPIIFQIIFF